MTVIGFAGTPGSGKTYEAVKKILDNLQMGRVVYSNIRGLDNPVCREQIKNLCGLSDLAIEIQLKQLEDDQIEEFWHHVPTGSLIVIDEVQLWFSSREWQSDKNKIFGKWASTHRHNGFDVVLITQDVNRVDVAVKNLLEWVYVFRKINFFGGAVQKKYICYGYGGTPEGQPLSKNIRTYDRRIFAAYKSYIHSDIKEQGIMRHVNVLKHPIFFIIPIVLVFTLYMLFFKSGIGTGDYFGAKKIMAQSSQEKETAKTKVIRKEEKNTKKTKIILTNKRTINE